MRRSLLAAIAMLYLALGWGSSAVAAHLTYGWQKVDDLQIFYREGGPPNAPTVVFLHGNPASSIQYDEVMRTLAEGGRLHVIAMDYPSFGYSDAPNHHDYAYNFDHLAETVQHFLATRGIHRYALYMQDYGAPVGFRLMQAAPEAVTGVIMQNGVIHLDGFPLAQDPEGELRRYWRNRDPAMDARRAKFTASLPFPGAANWHDSAAVSPDTVLLLNTSAQRPGVIDARNDLWADYGSNLEHYPAWQKLLRSLKVPVLVIWGARDDFFTLPGAKAYLRDAPQAELHVLDTGEFATLEAPDAVAGFIAGFAKAHDLR